MLSFSYKTGSGVSGFFCHHGVGQGFRGEIQKGNYFTYKTSNDTDNRNND